MSSEKIIRKETLMTKTATTRMLAKAIDASKFTQREIADRVGFNSQNMLSQLKSGEARVPLDRIPALAKVLEMDERQFLMTALEDYHPVVHAALLKALKAPLSDAEIGLVMMLRMLGVQAGAEDKSPLHQALKGISALLAAQGDNPQTDVGASD
jgi:transcriptional regulator with XRE-family HTH domain